MSLNLEALASAKRLSVEFLKSLGLRTVYGEDTARVRIPYRGETGEDIGVRFRHALDGADRFSWRRGDKVALYGLWRVSEGRTAGWLLLLEGESDCWTAWLHNIPALGIPGKGTWRPEWASVVRGLTIYLWREPGAGDLVERLTIGIPDLRIIIPPDGLKDLSDAHVRGDDVMAVVERLKADARPAADVIRQQREERRRREAEDALRLSDGLLDDSSLLTRIDDVLNAYGLAGDKRNARQLYLILTSRLLHRPANAAVEGPSAAGKNHLLACVLALFPEGAVYQLTAFSERFLAFAEEDFRHRVIVIGEASGLHRDGIGATIIRTLAWEGRLVYETVEKTDNGLQPRRIEKAGPTALITTTTRPLDPELATRMLTITVRDDPEQSRLIVRAAGRRAACGSPNVNLIPFAAAQSWLATAGTPDVAVPFAEVLAGLVDVSTVRVRRDFTQLLTLLQSSALLHQRQRPRDEHGRVVATLADYEIVYGIAAESFGTAANALTPAQRAAVEVVHTLCQEVEDIPLSKIAEHLRIDKSSASRRLREPIRQGYVLNAEDRRGRPGRYRPGEDLPPILQAIPTLEVLAREWGSDHLPENARIGATPQANPASEEAGDRCTAPMQPEERCGATPEGIAGPAATVETRVQTDVPAGCCSDTADSEGLCHACGGTRFWRAAGTAWRCAACHPPAAPGLVVGWRDVCPQEAGH